MGRLIDVVEAVPVAMGGHAHDLNTATESAMSTELREERHTEVMAKKFIAFVPNSALISSTLVNLAG